MSTAFIWGEKDLNLLGNLDFVNETKLSKGISKMTGWLLSFHGDYAKSERIRDVKKIISKWFGLW